MENVRRFVASKFAKKILSLIQEKGKNVTDKCTLWNLNRKGLKEKNAKKIILFHEIICRKYLSLTTEHLSASSKVFFRLKTWNILTDREQWRKIEAIKPDLISYPIFLLTKLSKYFATFKTHFYWF